MNVKINMSTSNNLSIILGLNIFKKSFENTISSLRHKSNLLKYLCLNFFIKIGKVSENRFLLSSFLPRILRLNLPFFFFLRNQALHSHLLSLYFFMF